MLLGFNEPDLAGQANLTVAAALDLWPQLEATGQRLGSPAIASGGATAGGWLDQVLAGARQRGYRVDFITLHWYGSDFSTARELAEGPSAQAATGQLKGYLQAVYDRYHLPIWLTEYAGLGVHSEFRPQWMKSGWRDGEHRRRPVSARIGLT